MAPVSLRRASVVALPLLLLGCESLVDFDGLTGGTPKTGACPTGAVFCSGFEEGSKNVWSDADGNPDSTNPILVDPGPFDRTGNHVMKLTSNADLLKLLPQSYDKLYVRWYVRWEGGIALRGGLYGGGRDVVGIDNSRPKGDDWFAVLVRGRVSGDAIELGAQYPGMTQNCPNPASDCTADIFAPDPKPVVESNRWYCLAMELDAGTPTPSASGASGAADYWVDGVEAGPFGGLWLRSSEIPPTTTTMPIAT